MGIVAEALREDGRGDSSKDISERYLDKVRGSDISSDIRDEECGDSDSDSEDFESYLESSLAKTALENAEGVIDRLYRLAFKIRNPATRLGFSKAQNFQQIDPDTGVDLIEVFAAFDLQHVEQILLELQHHS